MTLALMLLRKLRNADSGADDSGWDDSGDDSSGDDSGDDSSGDDSGARGNRGNRGGWRNKNKKPNTAMQLQNQVEFESAKKAAALLVNKNKYKLFRMIPLVPFQSIGIGASVVINVTPTSKCFAQCMVAQGNFSITSLVFMGQTIVPNGTIDSKFFENVSTINMPINLELDTVPITGNVTNQTGVAALSSLTLQTWMVSNADSERF